MARVIHDNRYVDRNDANNSVELVDDDMGVMGMLSKLVYIVSAVIIGLLIIRFFLVLFGANMASGFVDFIYTVTRPLVAPFFGIFNYSPTYVNGRFEYETLIAIVVYTLLAWILLMILNVGRRNNTVV